MWIKFKCKSYTALDLTLTLIRLVSDMNIWKTKWSTNYYGLVIFNGYRILNYITDPKIIVFNTPKNSKWGGQRAREKLLLKRVDISYKEFL